MSACLAHVNCTVAAPCRKGFETWFSWHHPRIAQLKDSHPFCATKFTVRDGGGIGKSATSIHWALAYAVWNANISGQFSLGTAIWRESTLVKKEYLRLSSLEYLLSATTHWSGYLPDKENGNSRTMKVLVARRLMLGPTPHPPIWLPGRAKEFWWYVIKASNQKEPSTALRWLKIRVILRKLFKRGE